jgi:cell fate (sporulation/competence/biofilm development) regulator YmcA (YheA/YmcA/DUF963 family)
MDLPTSIEKTRDEYTKYEDVKESWKKLDAVLLQQQIDAKDKTIETMDMTADLQKLSSILDNYEKEEAVLDEETLAQRNRILETLVIRQRLSFTPYSG